MENKGLREARALLKELLEAGSWEHSALEFEHHVDGHELCAKVEAFLAGSQDDSKCPGHGRDKCVTCCWPTNALPDDRSGQIGWVVIDEAPSDAPANCRQRLMQEGKPYPRSGCSVCGAFSPKWRECDALLGK